MLVKNLAAYMYQSIFNRFPVIQAETLKVRHFSILFAHFGLPWDYRGKCHMDQDVDVDVVDLRAQADASMPASNNNVSYTVYSNF